MSRIAKADINKALSLAAKTIVDAGGSDGRTSRAEIRAKLTTLPPEQKKLVDIFFKFVDARDFKAGAQVTAKDVSKAVAYAKEHMIAKYDLNDNGLSKTEIAKMSLTGKLAVDLARALKSAPAATLSVVELGKEIDKAAKDVTFMSESDYTPTLINGKGSAGNAITEANLKSAFGATMTKFFEGDDDVTSLDTMKFDIFSKADAKAFLDDVQTAKEDEDYAHKNADGFRALRSLLEKNLTDVTVVKVGPKDANNKLATDKGLYSYLVIGKADDGQIAGMTFGSVET